MSGPALGPLDDAVAYRLHRLDRLLLTHLARQLRMIEDRLTPESYFVLSRIAHDAPVRQGDLVEPTLDDAPNVSRIVGGLVSAGLVDRAPDPADGRGRVLELTDRGHAVVNRLADVIVDERRRVFSGIDPDELDVLMSVFDRIEANLAA